MIIKLVNEFKLLPTKTRCRSVHAREFTAAQKNCGKSGLGHQASVLPGHWAAGPRAAGPLGRRAAGLSRAVGPDLLLAIPRVRLLGHLMIN